MRKNVLALMLCLAAVQLWAANPPLKGYSYAKTQSPVGNEWESPELIALNKEQPRAWFFSFADVESARKVLPENSSYHLSLDGDWKFHWAPNPDERPQDFFKAGFDAAAWDAIAVPSNWNVYGIGKDGSLKYGVPIYVNQPVIFQHSVKVDDWRGGVMRTPPASWTTYNHRNEVGSYLRNFEVPQEWDGRQVFINFDGVDSFFYLWVNGHYVGFSKNSRNAAAFNITPYLQKGANALAVEVYRNSDGSFLEAQDMFRLPGIFRSVALYSTPGLHIRDLVVMPDLDADYKDGQLVIDADIRNLNKKAAKDHKLEYTLYEAQLYSDHNTPVANALATATIAPVQAGETIEATQAVLKLENPKKWSAEHPHRYVLVAQLKDKKGRVVETVSTYTGFRKVEIKDTPARDDEFNLAGRYYYINGKTVKLKGVNRHETNPAVGHAITRTMMENEVMLMKRANINHVRNSHYPPAPYWFYLADKYGIYLEDEANIESHEYYYGAASLSHPAEWENAHVARVLEMAHATINNPSVVIWSLGNEAGPGKNFVTAYNELKKVDTSRPVQYERNNSIVDMGSNQYPSIGWMREAVKGRYNIKYPFHVSEYAHSMGNACGNLIDYWQAIESTNFFCGGAIWDWVDQAIYNYDKATGTRYLAYGGDFGDTPNDGQFVMNGIVFADLEPKPQYYEVKKVYQHIGVQAIDMQKGEVEVFNKYYFKDLTDYDLQWALYENGKEVKNGNLTLASVPARTKTRVTLPYVYANLKPGAEYFVKLRFTLKNDKPWAPRSFAQAEEQLLVKEADEQPSIAQAAARPTMLTVTGNDGNLQTIAGEGFSVTFDFATGTIHSLNYADQAIITNGNGPRLDAFRAFTNNDNWAYRQWFENGLHNLNHKVLDAQIINNNKGKVKDKPIMLSFTVESQAPCGARIIGSADSGRFKLEEYSDRPFGPADFKFTTNQIWTIYPDGSIELQAGITSNNPSLPLARLGYMMRVPARYGNLTYYGRGPIDNYNDRKSGQFIEMHQSTVKGEFINFPKPQNMGNHEDVRWCALTNAAGAGAVFVPTTRSMSISALPYSSLDLTMAPHPYQLPAPADTYLHLDLGVTGLGGNSCGQGAPLTPDRVFASHHNFGFIIRPAVGKDLTAVAAVSAAGEVPLSIVRSRSGQVSINSGRQGSTILYTVDKAKKPQEYTAPIALRGGGTITAWHKDNPAIKATSTFEKIESIATEVVFASSEEGGERARNLTDGDPNTIWHTMYSVTVAKHPHWVDLDAGEMKTINGFVYLPRQSGSNGNVKDYTIHISTDGQNWGQPVKKGTFERGNREKRVTFDKPVQGRYIRFTALSEQNGQDFASGAELMILAE